MIKQFAQKYDFVKEYTLQDYSDYDKIIKELMTRTSARIDKSLAIT